MAKRKKPKDKLKISKKIEQDGTITLSGFIRTNESFESFDEFKKIFMKSNFKYSLEKKEEVYAEIIDFLNKSNSIQKLSVELEEDPKTKNSE